MTELEQDLVLENLVQMSFELPLGVRNKFNGTAKTRGSSATAILNKFVACYIQDPAGTESALSTQHSGDASLSDSADGRATIALPYNVTTLLRLVHEDLSKALRGLDEVIPKIHGKAAGISESEGSKSAEVVKILKGEGAAKRGGRKHSKGIGSGREGRTR